MFDIKKGIKLPSNQPGVKKYPFAQMEVGDMFFVPTTDFERAQSSIRSSARKYFKMGQRFRILRFTQNGKPGIGVWRDADAT